MKKGKGSDAEYTRHLEFQDNALMPLLFGDRDRYLGLLQDLLGVSIFVKGNRIAITGAEKSTDLASLVLSKLYDRLEKGMVLTTSEIEAAVRLAKSDEGENSEGTKPKKANRNSVEDPLDEGVIPTRRTVVRARSKNQRSYIQALRSHDLVFGLGPAGTGKTYLAVAMGVHKLLAGEIDRIILSRPAVEAGEQLGFLPGDLREKVDPYLRPLYDALYDMLPAEQVDKRLHSGEIEIAPLAYMRGRTLAHAYVILDEAQNTTPTQMKMFLTRLGEGSSMAITGDLSQVDLPKGVMSGLRQAMQILEGVEGIAMTKMTSEDVVRHPLVGRIVVAYDKVLGGTPEQYSSA